MLAVHGRVSYEDDPVRGAAVRSKSWVVVCCHLS